MLNLRFSFEYQLLMSDFLYCQSADIDEKAIRKDKPEEQVKALAEAKVYCCVYFVLASSYCLKGY